VSTTMDELDTPIGGLPDGPTAEKTVAEVLREQYEAARARRTVGLKIPGYDSLYGVFRAVGDFREVHGATKPGPGGAKDEVALSEGFAVDLLLLASVGTYAVIDGERSDLPPLGAELHAHLFGPSEIPLKDAEAMYLLFPLGTYSMVEVATRLDQWQKGQAFQSDEELLGNS
jgi:hypothetical protein